ncbi:MAG: glycine C-acetyltransferase [Armatimonadetes bacterium CG06_land_8_20_14_3_00_66_21]|nr:glycine C-acetyltransferase [Armatimonadota bacterium]PIU94879.1 MAG: glycine C-acetyltransferase [Armatimonadetes bacterium CG06_land_8_20_14_3_00_66_21]
MYSSLKTHLTTELQQIRDAGLHKSERVLATPQGARIAVVGGRQVLNFCANNYLGLANDPRVVEAARASYERWGYGLSSVRFICGTQELHKELEARLTRFMGTEDTILYSSCFDANGGLFETLLGPEDAVLSDELNHASIIDGVRLCKAQRYRFRNGDMDDLEARLKEAAGARVRLIATDGVFSMDGFVAKLDALCDLADEYDAAVMVDDSHATGFVGKTGRGTHEYNQVMGRVDVITSTLGKALGGASGGFTTGRKEIVEMLRQRSRPYLFSNTLAPAIAATTLAVLDLLEESTELRDRLESNTRLFRLGMAERGFDIPESDHPICPILLGDAMLATKMADSLLEEGVYVVGFSYPVVPEGKARLRVQISAAHTEDDLQAAMEAFAKVRAELRAPGG